MSRRKQQENGGDTPRGNHGDVPFIDAHAELGEIPLDEIDTFIIPARDDKGTSERVTLSMTPLMKRQIDIIVHSKRFPYLRDSDFIRHACYRHLHFCSGIRQSIPKQLLPSIDATLEIARDEEMRLLVQEAFQKLQALIQHHQASGDHAEAIRLLNLVNTRIQGIQTSSWQRRFVAGFNDIYRKFSESIGLDGGGSDPS